MVDEVRIEGLDILARKLERLPKNLRNRQAGKALRAGGKLIRDRAKATAPVDTTGTRPGGTIKKNVAMRTSTGRRAGPQADVVVRIGVLSDRSGRNSFTDAFYWRFHEFGTSKMPARPFIRPAFESLKFTAFNKIIVVLKKGLQTEAIRS